MKSTFLRHALALVPALFLAACGGGGGGGGSSTSAPTTLQLAITAGNSQAVAAESFEASTNYEAAASGGSLVTGVQVDSAAGTNPVLLAKAASQLLSKTQGGSPAMATGVTATGQTVGCAVSGTLTVSYNIASTSGTLSAGDSMSFDAANCTEGTGAERMVMNGFMSIQIVSGTFNPSAPYPHAFTMKTTARNFTVNMGGETMTANGDITLAITERSISDVGVTMSSTMVSSTVGSHSITLKGYTHKVTETAAGTTIEMAATIETNNARLGTTMVSYQVSTVTPIVINTSGQVTAGAIKVTGSGGSSLVLTATGTDTFSLQLDADGNGTYESTSTVTRTTLAGLL